MLLGTDELTILRGSKFYGTWQWINSVTGDPEDFAGLSATIKIKNIHEEFAEVKNAYEVGATTVEPLDVDSNVIKGRVDISLSKEDTLLFAIPEFEDDRYGESDFYSILSITLSTGEVILQAKVKVVESLESETLNFLLDEKDEAIIINGKLDNILARNDEFIATRDNLIDVVIPTSLLTYNTNHSNKLEIYNQNHEQKLSIYNQNDLAKSTNYNSNHINKLAIYNQNHSDKLLVINTLSSEVETNKSIVVTVKELVSTMKQNVEDDKNNIASMKIAIETIFDNFDDKFLGTKNTDPLLDNDENNLSIGALYYNSISKQLKFYNGVAWDNPVGAAQTYAMQAGVSESNALNYKNQAENFKNQSSTSATNANNSANTANTKASEANSSAISALASKNASATSESNAKASELMAKSYMDEINPNIFLEAIRMSQILNITGA